MTKIERKVIDKHIKIQAYKERLFFKTKNFGIW